MKFKKTLLAFCLIMCIFFCVSSVAAGDVNDTAIASENQDSVDASEATAEVNNQKIESDVISSSNEEILNTKDNGTFTALQNKIDAAAEGSTITLENDYKYNEGFNTTGIKISKNLTIEGNGHTIDGLHKSRIFHMVDESFDSIDIASIEYDVVLNNIKFINGYSQEAGGSICLSSDTHFGELYAYCSYAFSLTVNNCAFIDNKAEWRGGAISGSQTHSWPKCIITIYDSIFTNNTSEESTGGAIAGSGSVNVYNSDFISNSGYNGGALDANSVEVYNCNFRNNRASLQGGAINSDSGLIIENSQFDKNCARYGGAIYQKTFKRTKTRSGTSEYYTLYTYYGKILYCNFTYNTASDEGDLIDCYNYENNVPTTLEKCRIVYSKDSADKGICDAKTVDCEFIKVDEIYPILTINPVTKIYGSSTKLIVDLANNKGNVIANAEVSVVLNGKTYKVNTDSKGQASIDLNLGPGTYDVVGEYGGISTTSNVIVKSTLTTSDASGTYLNSKVTATFLDTAGKALASKQVTFKVNGKDYTSTTNGNGVAAADIDLGVGTYTVTAVNPVNNEQKEFKLVISKATSKIALASSQSGEVVTLTVALTPSAATGSVIFTVNGENKTTTIKSGKATLTLTDLKADNYTVTAFYNGDNNLDASASNTISFSVSDVYPVLTAKGVTKTYGTATKLVVYLKDNKGNAIANANVNVDIKGKVTPITTNSNGQATMAIGQAPGTYYAKITYPKAKQVTAKIVVKKATPKITVKAKTFKKSIKTKKYTVTLKTNQNKVMKNTKLTLKVNGKTYSATTNAKGQATFKITKLTKKGKFNAVVTYKGNAYYNKLSKKVQIKIN